MTIWQTDDKQLPKALRRLFMRTETKIMWMRRDTKEKKTQRILGEEQGEERGAGTHRGYESERREGG